MDLKNLSIKKVHEAMINGEFTSVDLVNEYKKVYEEKNGELNAYLEFFDDAIEQAKEADEKFKDGSAVLMTGIPVAIKDNILFKGHKAGAASKVLEGYTATYDADVIKKLREAGAVIIGRTNMDEFAMGASTENSAYGPTKNPHDTSRVPGGSSGGSVAAVASDMALVTLGSDTGGSIRQPSAFCGVVGLKPTYGSVSRSGLMAMGSSLDCIGPIGKSVSDVEAVFETIKGKDEMDSTSIPDDLYEKKNTKKPVIGVPTINYPKYKGDEQWDLASNENLEKAVKKFKDLGYDVKTIELPNIRYSVPAYYVVMPAEVSANLSRFDGVKYGLHKDGENLIDDYFKTRGEGLGAEVKRRVLVGTYVLSAGYADQYYYKAQAVRDQIRADYKKAFENVDVILTPTTAGPAFKIGEKINDPVAMYLEDIFTSPANMTGLPAMSVPSGAVSVNGKNLPLGVQLMASHQREDLLFKVGKEFLGEK
ncbi:MAG TPA: Asp-tRNA(Asn)/Glu-tRNA(Gln) amidotransferase subunit GatA [Candidatus Paceibacterota bacterium]|jgi:aspartyl-tRNA(Asn)/glutamyl-tRNA(Gln) amidotransferase subunit A|nr:Asp-tRNA(Asn)/Glu-tRNA(Gln) amidotransferase GatCAB subunit A [Parcubacteria group bacterium]MDP6119752.1 Asp-tRNA(Asn)/Glu-tRNA(Gln) amidotransferase subunit GatA [Candidatus Paceibacterota bacterium]HJN62925.1 Asp-tRNA(Asn)/Glu-tRNA(Gln) amidotransferase subunit GatA [Candidatus Paceibacterota bacterium]|tara:strand:+ start:3834 stop:5267 length:1434 start_codon:yes stop_codon:yes gene_type:complete